MTRTRSIRFGKKSARAYQIDLPGATLVLAKGSKGFVMCGYLDIKVADKFGQSAAVVRGIKTIDDLLEKSVTDVSAQGKKRGIKPGMTGREALRKLL